jgi:hypothetical protein
VALRRVTLCTQPLPLTRDARACEVQFNVDDFAKQRCRWYAGLWLCCKSPNLPCWRRYFLGAHVVSSSHLLFARYPIIHPRTRTLISPPRI